ncbi:MAG: hypothetical protein ACOCRO_00585 [Halanaerobiales bacterium]
MGVSKEEIKRLYLDDKITQQEIADKFGLKQWEISKILKDFPEVDSKLMRLERNLPTKELLEELHHKKRLTITEISKKLGRSRQTVSSYLDYYGIDKLNNRGYNIKEDTLKDLYYKQHLSQKEIAIILGCSKEAVMRAMKHYGIITSGPGRYGITEEMLEYEYCELNMSQYEIAKKHQVSRSAVSRWLIDLNLPEGGVRIIWDLNKMQEYSKQNAPGYKVLKTVFVESGEANLRKAKVSCPNQSHNSYWVFWTNFVSHKKRCMQCHYEENNITRWTKEKIRELYEENDLHIINIDEFKSNNIPLECLTDEGYKIKASIDTLVRGSNLTIIKSTSDVIFNIKLYCKLNRPKYEFIDTEFRGVHEPHKFRYIGDGLPEGIDRDFEIIFSNFFYKGYGHTKTISVGEMKIKEFLLKNNILFEQ